MSDDHDSDEFSHLPKAGSEEEIRQAKADLWRKIAEQHRGPAVEPEPELQPEPEWEEPDDSLSLEVSDAPVPERHASTTVEQSASTQDGRALWEEFLAGENPEAEAPAEEPVDAPPEEPQTSSTPRVRLSGPAESGAAIEDGERGGVDPKVKDEVGDKDEESGKATSKSDELPEEPADNSELLASDRKRALIVAGVFHLVILLVMAIVHVVPMAPKLAEIVAIPSVDELEKPSWKKVTTAMPKSAMIQPTVAPIMANATSNFAMPDLDLTPTASELNVGTSFGSFGMGGTNGTGQLSFLGTQGSGDYVVFVVDVSASMNAAIYGTGSLSKNRLDLLKKELTKSLAQMRPGTKYEILYFSDFAWSHTSVKPGDFQGISDQKWELDANGGNSNIPQFTYLSANAATTRRSREIVSETIPYYETNWGSGLMMALRGSPRPDVIFFMTDGDDSNADKWIEMATRENSRGKRSKINVTGMMISPRSAEPLDDLARRNGGKFTVVLSNGTVVDGDDYFSGRR